MSVASKKKTKPRRGRRECYAVLLLVIVVVVTTSSSVYIFDRNKQTIIIFDKASRSGMTIPRTVPSWRKDADNEQQHRLHDFDHMPSPTCDKTTVPRANTTIVMSNLLHGSPVKARPGKPWDHDPVDHAARVGLLTYDPALEGRDFWVNAEAANQAVVRTGEARCHFPGGSHFSIHIAHAFQYLAACWSYWQYWLEQAEEGNNVGAITPVLYFDKDHPSFPSPTSQMIKLKNGTETADFSFDSGFAKLASNRQHLQSMHGLLLMLYDWGLVFRHDHINKEEVVNTCVTFTIQNGYAMLHPRHGAELRKLGLAWTRGQVKRHDKFYAKSHIEHEKEQPLVASPSDLLPTPQITILNRQGNRRLLNQDVIVKAINQEIYQPHNDKKKRRPEMQTRVAYFESSSFDDQLLSMQETDILISPHGAQLTMIPFLSGQTNGKCAAMHELFPPMLCIPYFFSSLAHHTGIRHSYTSFDNSTTTTVTETCQCDWADRFTYRPMDMCPAPLDRMMDTVRQLIKEWQDCVRGLGG